MASNIVNLCLVPEFKYDLYGDKGVLEYALNRIKTRGHINIVIAEGASIFFILYLYTE